MRTLDRPGMAAGWRLLVACLAMLMMSAVAAAPPIRVVTEEYPPYNYAKNGDVQGVSTAVVRAVMAEAGIEAPIQLMPWARAYDLALHSENVLIYSITRTPAREALFKWVGQVAPSEWFLYALRGREIPLKTLEDAKAYRIATVNQDVGEQFLLERGFDLKRNLQSSNRYAHNYEKLKLGRVDLWIANSVVAAYLVREAGDDPAQQLKAALRLHELGGDGLYMAFSHNTSDAVVERFRRAFEALRRDGRLARLGMGGS
ncbi:substrate-binding periplasmic protein [Denitromonas iodatirespirans]|uniref:ABC transporter substrate-binding protein n=1 Tax=Denitromonas iodatirespirans TaxID=2795389 RepID=A0A944DDU8_DENI1|nr:ABC transporter substrate-binding protein [Denitromonas iodatirespirans]MBT0963672.1 ABC transporter substrate-binding protein [Denitromonas iodatirespirans]